MAQAFIMLGVLFLAGLAADALGARTRLPRVTLLLVLGIVAGPSVLGLIPETAFDWYEALSTVALTLVAFLLGEAFTAEKLRAHGRAILSVSLGVVLATLAGVGLGLWLLGVPPELAIALAAIATATDPAATGETLREAGARGPFAETLKGVVAIDDAWGMIAFALAIVAAQGIAAGVVEAHHVTQALWEVGGAVALGLGLGLPAAYLTGRLRPGEPTRLEALGLVFLAAGLSLWLGVSFLLAAMTTGAVIANLASHHDRAFSEIEAIETPFLVLFFVLAGAAIDWRSVVGLGALGALYVGLRIAARVAGGWVGGQIGGMGARESLWIGPSLLAQAGVAVGMALVSAQALPEHADTILALAIGTTVLFELLGPLALMRAVRSLPGTGAN
ncbi:cation:proton antiporter [Citreimonas sp.]|uniref:cation:proton antiporter n=1 Tax=Citreimonas sp. TaxID=3036715 RepID=UPI004059B431